MKFAIVIVAAFLVLEASCFVVPQQQSVRGASDVENLARVKRGCACGPHGCLCNFSDIDDSFLKVVGAERVKRDVNTENTEKIGEQEQLVEIESSSENLERVKRGCACGPYGCLCRITDAVFTFN